MDVMRRLDGMDLPSDPDVAAEWCGHLARQFSWQAGVGWQVGGVDLPSGFDVAPEWSRHLAHALDWLVQLGWPELYGWQWWFSWRGRFR